MQLVLRRAHEEFKERDQAPSVAREQLVSETLFHILYIHQQVALCVNLRKLRKPA